MLNLLIFFIVACVFMSMVVSLLFGLAKKNQGWDKDSSITFECGFSSGFLSRFSFSMHFYTIGIIFLFLDLELCFIMPFFNESFSSLKLLLVSWTFVMILLGGVVAEWNSGELEWKF